MLCYILAFEKSRPSSLPARVAFRVETLLGPGAKKDGCFRRLATYRISALVRKRRIKPQTNINEPTIKPQTNINEPTINESTQLNFVTNIDIPWYSYVSVCFSYVLV